MTRRGWGRTGVSAALQQRLDEDQSRVIVLDEQHVELAVGPRASRQQRRGVHLRLRSGHRRIVRLRVGRRICRGRRCACRDSRTAGHDRNLSDQSQACRWSAIEYTPRSNPRRAFSGHADAFKMLGLSTPVRGESRGIERNAFAERRDEPAMCAPDRRLHTKSTRETVVDLCVRVSRAFACARAVPRPSPRHQ